LIRSLIKEDSYSTKTMKR